MNNTQATQIKEKMEHAVALSTGIQHTKDILQELGGKPFTFGILRGTTPIPLSGKDGGELQKCLLKFFKDKLQQKTQQYEELEI